MTYLLRQQAAYYTITDCSYQPNCDQWSSKPYIVNNLAKRECLTKLTWCPHIHSEIVKQAQSCKHCIDKGKNLKPLITKNNLGTLTTLVETNEEIQMDFAGPIPYKNNIWTIYEHKNNIWTKYEYKNNTQNNYILVTVDRLSRYPHAEIFNNCDTNTALECIESYCKVHGTPRSIRCDQGQAFKAKEFDIFCKNKNIKLILAPAGDHRGTGMVERLIQTIKKRLAVLDIDPICSNATLANRITNMIENNWLIPNTTKKLLHSKHSSEENQKLNYQKSQQKHHTKTSHTKT